MLVTYDGIVLSRREVGENSCFIDILTDEQGLIEASAHGANKINSNLLSSAALFSYATFCLNKNKMRYTVNSAKPKFSFHAIGGDIEKLALASYFAQAVKFCTPSEQNQLETSRDSLVRFFAISLFETLRAGENRTLSAVKSAFELRYSVILGYAPNLVSGDCLNPEFEGERVLLLPETLFAMRNIVFSELNRCFKFNIGNDAEKQLAGITEDYFLYRTERTFPALRYFLDVSGKR